MKLSEIMARIDEDAAKDAMLAQTVKNPETDQDITVKTALGYPKEHPARKAAAKIYAQYMQKVNPTTPQFKPRPRPMRPENDPWYAQYGDDAYDAKRDYELSGNDDLLPPSLQQTTRSYRPGRLTRRRF